MSPCHCQYQQEYHTVLQSKIHMNNAMMEPACICVQELLGLGMSSEVVNIRDSIYHKRMHINALVALLYRTYSTVIGTCN